MLRKFSNSPQREFFLSQHTDSNAFKLEINTILERDKEKSNLAVLNPGSGGLPWWSSG